MSRPRSALSATSPMPSSRANNSKRFGPNKSRAVKSGREAVEISTQRYTAGKSSYYEVLTAQQELFPPRRKRAGADRVQSPAGDRPSSTRPWAAGGT